MQFKVRRAILGDEMALRTVRLQALADSPRAFSSTYEREAARTLEDWRRWLAPSATFILEADGEPCGLAAGVPDQNAASVIELTAMWVRPEARGKGAADALVSSVKSWAAEMGASSVRLIVNEDNTSARRCYERCGFRPTGRRSVLERTGDIEIEMICNLHPA